ncbi:hypothetical protein GCM10020221_18680 [Streptomyces thioluteus]|uniref:Cytochrome c domain-containing protein n=1 Tax=Streptomyces thioluteus TaxID=66431 RepID=A0ABP6J6T6_STRTU
MPAVTAPALRAPPTGRAWSAWVRRQSTSRSAPAACRCSSRAPRRPRKKPVYTSAQIDQLAAYISSLGAGPAAPTKDQYSPEGADVAKGGELFRLNCSQCHNFTGKGGALSNGKFAPNLEGVDPKHVYEAMQTGPQNMPSFPDTVLSQKNKKDIVAYLDEVNSSKSESPGGLGLGGFGPVSEGLFAWVFGLGALIAVAIWVAPGPQRPRSHE